MNAEDSIKNFSATFREYEQLVDNIRNAATFAELSKLERQHLNAHRALQYRHAEAFHAVLKLAEKRRAYLRNNPVVEKPVEEVHEKKKTVEKKTKSSKRVKKAE